MKIKEVFQQAVFARFIKKSELEADSDQDWSWLPRMSKEIEHKSGIYAVFMWSEERSSWYVYVGQSQNLQSRLKWHCAVDRKSFPNRKYKNIHAKYGDSVRVRVLETCSLEDISKAEHHWMKLASEHMASQFLLNVRLDNTETNRGLSNEWIKEQWATSPDYRKKMRKALKVGRDKANRMMAEVPEFIARKKLRNQTSTQKREERRASDPLFAATCAMNMTLARHHDALPLRVKGAGKTHLFNSALSAGAALKTKPHKVVENIDGELYGFRIETVSWEAYLKFFKTAPIFKCEPLREGMSASEAALSLWNKNPLAGTSEQYLLTSPCGKKLFFRNKKGAARTVGVKHTIVDTCIEKDADFHGWSFTKLTSKQAAKYLNYKNPKIKLPVYSYSQKQVRTKAFLKGLS